MIIFGLMSSLFDFLTFGLVTKSWFYRAIPMRIDHGA